MIRSLVNGLGLLAMIAVVIIGAYFMVKNFSTDMSGSSGAGDAEGQLIVRVSGDPGVAFDGDYSTATGTKPFNNTLGAAPVEIVVPDESIAGVSVVTVNIQRRGTTGYLKAELVENGRIVQSQETNAATGAVSLTYSP